MSTVSVSNLHRHSSAKSTVVTNNKIACLSQNHAIVSSLVDLEPLELATGATHVRRFFSSLQFREVMLSPFDAFPISYEAEQVNVPNAGQLRYNTEPEIWGARADSNRFFSVSPLFRREQEFNVLRRLHFLIVDFYSIGTPAAVFSIFRELLRTLADLGLTRKLHALPVDSAIYDPADDAPHLTSTEPRWVITSGYDAAHSFFEVDSTGDSTRKELFLVTPEGYLEIGAWGICGWNRNPRYVPLNQVTEFPSPPHGISGMGFGLERLLLAERILATI